MVATSPPALPRSERTHTTASVSVIVPTYNERENVEAVLDRCASVLEEAGYEFEIIVVDDDSPDDTAALVEAEYAHRPNVSVHVRTEERGLATAVVRGFGLASGDVCTVIDADLQHPPEKIPALVEPILSTDRSRTTDDEVLESVGVVPAPIADGGIDGTRIDLAIGSRNVGDGGSEGWSRFRELVSSGARRLTNLIVPSARGIFDPMSGFFAVRRSAVTGVDLDPQGYKIVLELLSKCDLDGVTEVPYTFTERKAGESKLTADQYQSFVEHVLSLSIGEYATAIGENPKRMVRLVEFLAVGALGVIVNTIVFYLSVTAGLHYLIGGGLAFLAAVQWNFAGNWLVTFDRPRDALLRRYTAFHAVCVVGLIVYELALTVLLFVPALPLLVANVGAIGVSSLWNFVGADSAAFADDIGERATSGDRLGVGVYGGDD